MNWSFSIYEIYLLGGILQVPGFLGLEDPFPGFLTEEIQEYMEVARQSLSDRGYLKQTEDGFLLDPDVMQAIQVMTTSVLVVVAAHDDSSMYVHLAKDWVVEQESMMDSRIAISAYKNPELPKEHIHNFLTVPDTPAASGPSIVIKPAVLEDARKLITTNGQISACKEFLIQKGMPIEAATALAETLATIVSKGSVMILNRKGLSIEPRENLAWVIGNRGGWIVEISPEHNNSSMFWKPISSSAIGTKIDDFLEEL